MMRKATSNSTRQKAPLKQETLVTIRLRPLSDSELERNQKNAWLINQNSISQQNKYDPAVFSFDNINAFSEDNRLLYSQAAKNTVWSAMEGINGVVLAYGQTASGKTYSMMGVDEQPGIIPQAVDDVFSYIREQTGDKEYLLRAAYIEIYNETIRDLLSPDNTDIRFLEDRRRGVYISPLKEEIVTSPKQVMRIIQRGESNRHFGTTDYNIKSSRSHTILQIIIESRDSTSNPITPSSPIKSSFKSSRVGVTISQLNLIDLAGSEKAASDIDRRKEGAFINKSLLSLGNVISKITEDKGGHIPFRDSKLTRVLQTSLSGNSKISVICTVSPANVNEEETLNTLKFAQRVKKIPIRAQQNFGFEDQALLQKYKMEILELKNKLNETNLKLERERSQSDVTQLLAERQLFEQQLHQSHLVRLALKERIDHLTKLILTSQTITPNAILDWNAPVAQNNKRASVMIEGLLPSSVVAPRYSRLDIVSEGGDTSPPGSPTVSANTPPSRAQFASSIRRTTMTAQQHRLNRLSRQMSDKDFYQKHIQEIDSRDEKIKNYNLLFQQLKDTEDENVLKLINDFETAIAESNSDIDQLFPLKSVKELNSENEKLKKENFEIEIILGSQEEKINLLEILVKEKDSELLKLRNFPIDKLSEEESMKLFKNSELYSNLFLKNEAMKDKICGLEDLVKTLKITISDLREKLRKLEEVEFEKEENAVNNSSNAKNRDSISSTVSTLSVQDRIREFQDRF
ncbi:hypothetical protein HK099_007017 [Clydaea vesicula]|uniref:Kinesin-like protein n=1 Tax=Clydaea vesicula TaxID=447962 RepID=A0AAD5XYR0_9FUNG|nr:hypothetical protein HK099_007017 [Clydaea vesicula]